MAPPSRLMFSAAAARAAAASNVAGVDDDDDLDEEPGEEIESAPPLKVGEERDIHGTGIRKKLLKEGIGWVTPLCGDEATVHYVGKLIDGTQFSSSRDKGECITLKLGQGQLVRELDTGILTMKKGEVALFTLPPVGSGDSVTTTAPPGSTLQFEVELISWIPVVDICRDGGIIKRILQTGDYGQLSDLDEVAVKYLVKLPDDSVVADASGGVEFHINEGHFCPALSKVILTMKSGERCTSVVKPQYAFGMLGREKMDGYPAVPPNTELHIDMELTSFKPVIDVTGDMKVTKKIIKAGQGIHKPREGEPVRVRYAAMLEDHTVFEKVGYNGHECFEFVIGEEQVIAGLDRAVATMSKGETAIVTVKPEYGFGESEVQRALASVPACSTLTYEVEMVDFTKEREPWELNAQERILAATKIKEKGNDLFKDGKLPSARRNYERAMEFVNEDVIFEADDIKLVRTLRVSCWLNSAACCLKVNDFHGAVQLCSKVLDVDCSNVKALYRRAQAFMGNHDLDLADFDLRKALDIDPHNKEVKSVHRSLKQLQGEKNERDAKLFGNIFAQTRNVVQLPNKKLKIDDLDIEKEAEVRSMETEAPTASTNSSVEGMILDRSAV